MRHRHQRGGKRQRRLELAMLAPIESERPKLDADPLAWVDAISDDELADIIGPSWAFLTGRNADHLIPDQSTDEGGSHAA